MDANQSRSDPRDSPAFLWKKWLLFGFCCVSILVTIVMAALAGHLIDEYIKDHPDAFNTYNSGTYKVSDDLTEAFKTTCKVIIYLAAAVAILFILVGLMGAYKEHYCMTVTYAVLMTIATLGSIGTASQNSYYWANFVFYLISCGLAIAFAIELYRRRQFLFANPTPIVIQSTVPTTTVAYTQPAGGQQYAQVAYGQPAYGQPAYGQGGYGQQQQQEYGKHY